MFRWHFTILVLLLASGCALTFSCQNQIRVDSARDGSADEGGNVTIIEDLQTALLMSESNSDACDCFDVSVAPGNYTLTQCFTIETNFILRGSDSVEGSVFVTFNVVDLNEDSSPPYVIQFQFAEFVKISGINFYHSPGIIGFDNITKVVIEDSSFRFV